LLFSFALEFIIRKIQENQDSLEFSGTYYCLVCAADVNLVGKNINTIQKKTKTRLGASMEVGLDVNTEN
jgi:hypothetical protein